MRKLIACFLAITLLMSALGGLSVPVSAAPGVEVVSVSAPLTLDGTNITATVSNHTTQLDLTSMITVTPGATWTMHTSSSYTGTSNKIINPLSSGPNTRYIRVTLAGTGTTDYVLTITRETTYIGQFDTVPSMTDAVLDPAVWGEKVFTLGDGLEGSPWRTFSATTPRPGYPPAGFNADIYMKYDASTLYLGLVVVDPAWEQPPVTSPILWRGCGIQVDLWMPRPASGSNGDGTRSEYGFALSDPTTKAYYKYNTRTGGNNMAGFTNYGIKRDAATNTIVYTIGIPLSSFRQATGVNPAPPLVEGEELWFAIAYNWPDTGNNLAGAYDMGFHDKNSNQARSITLGIPEVNKSKLAASIAEAELIDIESALVSDWYDDECAAAMSALGAAIVAAKAVFNDEAATQTQVNGAATALNAAIAVANAKSQLAAALDKAITAYELPYTVSQAVKDTFLAAINSAIGVVGSAATVAQIEASISALEAATLVYGEGIAQQQPYKAALAASLTAAKAINIQSQLYEGWFDEFDEGCAAAQGEITAAIAPAQAVFLKLDATQTEIDNALSALNAALLIAQAKAELATAADEALWVFFEDYLGDPELSAAMDPEDEEIFITAIEKAMLFVGEKATAAEVNAEILKLETAVDTFVALFGAQSIDKSVLGARITFAQGIFAGITSGNPLVSASIHLNQVLNLQVLPVYKDSYARQTEIDAAVVVLNAAIDIALAKVALAEVYNEAKALYEADPSATGAAELLAVIGPAQGGAAQMMLNNATATIPQISELADRITAAIATFKGTVNKAELADRIAAAEAIKIENHYEGWEYISEEECAASQGHLNTAIAAAKAAMLNAALTQDGVSLAVAALNAAIEIAEAKVRLSATIDKALGVFIEDYLGGHPLLVNSMDPKDEKEFDDALVAAIGVLGSVATVAQIEAANSAHNAAIEKFKSLLVVPVVDKSVLTARIAYAQALFQDVNAGNPLVSARIYLNQVLNLEILPISQDPGSTQAVIDAALAKLNAALDIALAKVELAAVYNEAMELYNANASAPGAANLRASATAAQTVLDAKEITVAQIEAEAGRLEDAIVLFEKLLKGYVFSDGAGKELKHLTSSKLVTTLNYINVSAKTENLIMYVAVYKPDGKLLYIGGDMKENILSGEVREFRVEIDMPENADGSFAKKNYSAQVFFLDSKTYVPAGKNYLFPNLELADPNGRIAAAEAMVIQSQLYEGWFDEFDEGCAASLGHLNTAIAAAKAIILDAGSSQNEILFAVMELDAAMEIAEAKIRFAATIDEALRVYFEDFLEGHPLLITTMDPAEEEAYIEALEVAFGALGEVSTLAQIESAISAQTAAIKKFKSLLVVPLIDKSVLKTRIEYAQGLFKDVTSGPLVLTRIYLNQVINLQVLPVYQNVIALQPEVDAAVVTLNAAIDIALAKVKLADVYNEALALLNANPSAPGFAALQTAVNTAKTVLDAQAITVAQVEAAVVALRSAITQF